MGCSIYFKNNLITHNVSDEFINISNFLISGKNTYPYYSNFFMNFQSLDEETLRTKFIYPDIKKDSISVYLNF